MLTAQLPPAILALDFDGVLCDGIAEYFYSSNLAYAEIWQSPNLGTEFESAFRRLRPVIETGWEMPVLLRALKLGKSLDSIENNWSAVSKEIITTENLESKAIAETLDQVRDRLIVEELDNWLGLQQFYPGVIAKLRSLLQGDTLVYIISTKEGRFIKALLEQAGVQLPPESIIGKEIKQPKYQTLTQLLVRHNCQPNQVWFIEDRLQALELVEQQPNLQGVGLFLATWGYNTPEMRASIANHPLIQLLSLEQFQQLNL